MSHVIVVISDMIHTLNDTSSKVFALGTGPFHVRLESLTGNVRKTISCTSLTSTNLRHVSLLSPDVSRVGVYSYKDPKLGKKLIISASVKRETRWIRFILFIIRGKTRGTEEEIEVFHTLGGSGEGRVQGRGKWRGCRCYSGVKHTLIL